MTVPNLMSNFRKSQTETGIRVAYKILNDALMMPVVTGKAPNMSAMIIASNTAPDLTDDFGSIINHFATNYLVPYLKVAKTCEYGIKDTTCGILYPSKTIDGTRIPNMGMYNPYQKYRIQLTNGMEIGVGKYTNGADDGFSFLVDINGKSGPNRLAYDQFYFVISADKPSWMNDPYYDSKHNFIQGGLSYRCRTSENAFDASINSCNNTNSGAGCAAVLQQNGWKIPDDYPVKKF